MNYIDRINSIADFLEQRSGKAKIGIILGSGLGDYANSLKDSIKVPYSEIIGFPVSTVKGHAGIWHHGELYGKSVIMMQGRFHAYEGYGLEDVTLPVRVMKKLGVETLIVTNAAGSANSNYGPGSLMLINDYINYTGRNPLVGPNLDEFGPRFPDMSHAFSPELRELAKLAAKSNNTDLKEGVYCWFTGPTFESPAEVRMARILGADACGMSTVPEVIVANHSGIKCLGISCITNFCAGMSDTPLTHSEVMETGKRVAEEFKNLLNLIIKDI